MPGISEPRLQDLGLGKGGGEGRGGGVLGQGGNSESCEADAGQLAEPRASPSQGIRI